MFFADIVTALIIGLVVALLFGAIMRGGGPGWGFLLLFLFIFLATWAGGLWIWPFGPVWFGVYWMPFLLAGVFVAVLIAAAGERGRPRTPRREAEEARAEAAAEAGVSALFWVLVAFLVLAVILGYTVRAA